METTATTQSADCQVGLRMPLTLREKVHRNVRRISFERDRKVSMNTWILEAIHEKLEREAA